MNAELKEIHEKKVNFIRTHMVKGYNPLDVAPIAREEGLYESHKRIPEIMSLLRTFEKLNSNEIWGAKMTKAGKVKKKPGPKPKVKKAESVPKPEIQPKKKEVEPEKPEAVPVPVAEKNEEVQPVNPMESIDTEIDKSLEIRGKVNEIKEKFEVIDKFFGSFEEDDFMDEDRKFMMAAFHEKDNLLSDIGRLFMKLETLEELIDAYGLW